ncbi:MAG: response regulator [Hydrotalea flava]|uniref:response regulator n=1 Tax=Hydrotalea TaxID=1004300 RepID=UPI0009447420|nr:MULTISPECIES: response regulator [Hydrotalea]MBY0347135.1 response regulator [Hydrotalea flava]NIM35246.1 response regulator [Hydrotalea flava]NIM38102.1 response regulator [Hydrotalea flava]NIN03265.1 response regulator [Hydrotalea flava]NIN14960.1 response regulator [Hydrotalea flava]
MKVLVVESNPILLKILTIRLSEAKYTVYSSLEGEHVHELIVHIKPDILITKLKLKYASGLELIKLAKSKFPNIFIVVITKLTQEEIINDLKKSGVNKYIKRPFNIEQILTAISEFKSKQIAQPALLNLPESIPLYKYPVQLYKDGTNEL